MFQVLNGPCVGPLLFHMSIFYWHTCRVAVGSRVISSLDHVSYFYWSTWRQSNVLAEHELEEGDDAADMWGWLVSITRERKRRPQLLLGQPAGWAKVIRGGKKLGHAGKLVELGYG